VAALIAQGKSNREIAEALVVGERTIETHVENILSKLGFDSRTQIAAWAVQKRLASEADYSAQTLRLGKERTNRARMNAND
jgi:non-specific serine/threonine protein kinase